NGETSSTFEIQIHNPKPQPDPILGTTTNLSNVNLTRIFTYDESIQLNVSSAGTAAHAGLQRNSPTTLDGALTFIANNPHIKRWKLNVAGGDADHSFGLHHEAG